MAIGTPASASPDFTLPAGPFLPEMAAPAHLAVVVKGHALSRRAGNEPADLGYAFGRLMGPSGLKGRKDTPGGGHEALFNPLWNVRVTLCSSTGTSGVTEISGIDDKPQVCPIFFSCKWITQVAGRTSQDGNRVRCGGVFIGLMTGDTAVGLFADLHFKGIFLPYEKNEDPRKRHKC